MYYRDIKDKFDYNFTDIFMGFHCGNTCSTRICNPEMKYQRIKMASVMRTFGLPA